MTNFQCTIHFNYERAIDVAEASPMTSLQVIKDLSIFDKYLILDTIFLDTSYYLSNDLKFINQIMINRNKC